MVLESLAGRLVAWLDVRGAVSGAIGPGPLEETRSSLPQGGWSNCTKSCGKGTAPTTLRREHCEALPSANACSWWWPPSAAAARAARCKRTTATTCAPAHSRSLRPAEALPGGLRVGRLDGLVQLHGALPAVRQQDQDQEEVGALLRW